MIAGVQIRDDDRGTAEGAALARRYEVHRGHLAQPCARVGFDRKYECNCGDVLYITDVEVLAVQRGETIVEFLTACNKLIEEAKARHGSLLFGDGPLAVLDRVIHLRLLDERRASSSLYGPVWEAAISEFEKKNGKRWAP